MERVKLRAWLKSSVRTLTRAVKFCRRSFCCLSTRTKRFSPIIANPVAIGKVTWCGLINPEGARSLLKAKVGFLPKTTNGLGDLSIGLLTKAGGCGVTDCKGLLGSVVTVTDAKVGL
ncbi:hypothetical protein GGTG_02186, partial [Gaeumannomyces tritici R3-111a-1]